MRFETKCETNIRANDRQRTSGIGRRHRSGRNEEFLERTCSFLDAVILSRLAAKTQERVMSRLPRIAVVGSANTDMITFSDTFPRPGETIFGTGFDLGFGGKGANQAVAARYCGADVAMVANVGQDLFGEATVKNFQALGIGAAHVRVVDGVPSGVAPIFVEPNGQNRIIVVKGANDTLKPADVDAAASTLKDMDVLILQFEIPLETVYYAVQFADKHNIRCIVNPAQAQTVELDALAAADYFVPNETEAEAIAGLPVHSIDEAQTC